MSSDIKITASPLQIIPSPCLNGSLNIFIDKVNAENTCIICLDSDNLIKNNRCSCIYYFHQNCIKKLEKTNKCILCKKEQIKSDRTSNNQINLIIHIEESQSCCCSLCLCIGLIVIIVMATYSIFKFT